MTIRQMFSHTSGLPGTHEDWVLSADDITLQQAAQFIATNNLIAAPGAVLCYGGLSMHLAGACAEIASGQSWSNLVEQRLKQPLGLTPPPTATRPTRASPAARPARSTNTPPSCRCS
jgi:CubicO group peptidase (beta-lactamase class C family)